MKTIYLFLGLVIVAAILATRSVSRPVPAPRPKVPGTFESERTPLATQRPALDDSAPAETGASGRPQSNPHRGGSPLAAELNAPGFDARHDVATLHAMLRQYLRLLHGRQGLPIGNDSDLSRVLTGRNPMKLVLLPPTHPAISANGRLRDRWGTPYFIHPRGNLAFEIRSAGADRKLFTTDDIVENPDDAGADLSALAPGLESTAP